MNLLISVLVFVLCCLFFLDWERLLTGRPFKKTMDVVLSRQPELNYSSSALLKRLGPIINLTVKLLRINGGAPRWEKQRKTLSTIYADNAMTVEQFVAIKVLCAGAVFLYFSFISMVSESAMFMLLNLIVTFAAYYIPDQLLNIKIKKRKWEIHQEIPSVLLSIAVTTDAGLNLLQALDEVCAVKQGAFPQELQKTLQQISIGIPQKEAFENLADRIMIDEVTIFVSVLTQTLEKGAAGMTLVLREQANQAWMKRRGIAKELAGKASIKLFLPMIGLVLPALMIFLIVPAVFSILAFFNY